VARARQIIEPVNRVESLYRRAGVEIGSYSISRISLHKTYCAENKQAMFDETSQLQSLAKGNSENQKCACF
jgi:hypothetical protein